MTDPLLRQDLQKLLAALAEGPKTQAELVAHLHLSSTRIGFLLAHLQQRRVIHAPHKIPTDTDHHAHRWALRSPSIPEEDTS